MSSHIRILLVDDSVVFREALAKGLSHEPRFFILPTSSSPIDAIDKIKQYQPHIIVCDIEMPGMNGIEFLIRIKSNSNIPIIMLSSRDDLRQLSLKSGANAFISKPKVANHQHIKKFILEIMQTIIHIHSSLHTHAISNVSSKNEIKVIAIGASTGGTESISTLLKQLPANLPPIVIAQHIPEHFSTMFAKRLNDLLPLTVKEASRLEPLQKNHVYIAPGNDHMSIKYVQSNLMIQCQNGDKINGHRPSVDVLFQSVAQTVKQHAIGVILTGMGKDGAQGLLSIRQQGGYTIGQDEKTSIVYGMPKAAFDIGAVCKQIPLERIAHEILMHI